jgi:hypothetical protein
MLSIGDPYINSAISPFQACFTESETRTRNLLLAFESPINQINERDLFVETKVFCVPLLE